MRSKHLEIAADLSFVPVEHPCQCPNRRNLFVAKQRYDFMTLGSKDFSSRLQRDNMRTLHTALGECPSHL